MARYFKIPFASTGDKVVIPDATQPDGSVSFTQGFGFDYERPNTDPAYKPVPREGTNGILHDVTEAIGVMQLQGVAGWTIDAQPYPINAQVYHSGKRWIALRATSVEPVEGADWTEFSAVVINNKLDKSALVQSIGSSATDIMSQKAVSDQLIGVGKTWSNVTATRAWNTKYTNTKGRTLPIAIIVKDPGSGNLYAGLFIDDELHSNVYTGASFIQTLCADIPDGSTYELKRTDNNDVIVSWKEL